MNTRVRGLLIFLASTVATVVLGYVLVGWAANAPKGSRIPKMPFAIPVVGMLWGLLELVTGKAFRELDAWYQKFPMWQSYPVGCLGGLLMLVLCYAWIVLLLRLVGI